MKDLKTSECPSLSGKSKLTYKIGLMDDSEICISIVGNSGSGVFNKDWIELEQVHSLLSSQEKITSGSLLSLFEGKNSNSAGFILAVLLKEGLLKISPGNKHYNLVGQAEFGKIVQGLIETAPEEKPDKKKAGKKGKGASS
jgi:hypothetical protein